VGLHVGVRRTEELFRPLDRQRLDDVDELATHPSVDSIYGLTMFEGDGGISDAILDRFPRLRRVDAEFSGPPPAALDRVICNFSWVSPELSPR